MVVFAAADVVVEAEETQAEPVEVYPELQAGDERLARKEREGKGEKCGNAPQVQSLLEHLRCEFATTVVRAEVQSAVLVQETESWTQEEPLSVYPSSQSVFAGGKRVSHATGSTT